MFIHFQRKVVAVPLVMGVTAEVTAGDTVEVMAEVIAEVSAEDTEDNPQDTVEPVVSAEAVSVEDMEEALEVV